MSVTTIVFDLSLTEAALGAAYRDADTSGKASLRSAHKASVMQAARDAAKDGGVLVSHLAGLEGVMVTPKAGPAPINYGAKLADLRATLQQALLMVEAGAVTLPEGATMPDLDEVDWSAGVANVKSAASMVTVAGRKVGRGKVADWIESVLGDEPTPLGDLRKAWVATSDYPQEAPTTGAIAACLDRDGGAEYGWESTEVEGRGRAVVRVA